MIYPHLKMKYQIVLEHSEEDCGTACLATIAKHYGRRFALNRIWEAVGTLELSRGAEVLGFNTRQVKVKVNALEFATRYWY